MTILDHESLSKSIDSYIVSKFLGSPRANLRLVVNRKQPPAPDDYLKLVRSLYRKHIHRVK